MDDVLHIKNMVCNRCITAVEAELEKLSIAHTSVTLGEVLLKHPISEETKNLFESNISKIGFELIVDRKKQLVQRVKTLIIDSIYKQEEQLNVNLSDYLSESIGLDYSYISKQFSELETVTIERFVIAKKVERVKELISYNELTLSEIAIKLHYSSIAHLSAQFKKITGMTPSQYKLEAIEGRKPLDD